MRDYLEEPFPSTQGRAGHVRATRLLIEAAIVFLVALGFFISLRLYSQIDYWVEFMPDDEALRAYPALRIIEGQLPYRDFATEDTPLSYYLNATALRLLGLRLSSLRTFAAVAAAVTALCAFLVGRRLMPLPYALIAPLSLLTAGQLTSNQASPAAYVIPVGMAGLLAVVRFCRTGRSRWVFLGGLCAGFAISTKLNFGLCYAMGYVLALVYNDITAGEPPEQSKRSRGWQMSAANVAEKTVLVLTALAPIVLMQNRMDAKNFLFLAVPVWTAIIVLVIGRRASHCASGSLLNQMVLLGLGAAVVILPWSIFFTAKLGPAEFVHHLVLRPHSLTASVYRPLRPLTLRSMIALAGAVVALWYVTRPELAGLGHRPSRWQLFLPIALLAVVCVPWPPTLSPGKVAPDAIANWGHLKFFLPSVLAVTLLVRVPTRGTDSHTPANYHQVLVPLLLFHTVTFLGLYPIPCGVHLLWVTTPFLITAAFCLYTWAGRMTAETAFITTSSVARIVPSATAVVIAVLALGLQAYDTARFIVRFDRNPLNWRLHEFAMPDPERVDVYVHAQTAKRIRGVAEFIKERTRPDEPIIEIPGSFFHFWTGRPNPLRLDYFWPGYASEEERRQMVDTLEAVKPRYGITRSVPHALDIPPYEEHYPGVAAYVRDNYHECARFGNYVIVELNSLSSGKSGAG